MHTAHPDYFFDKSFQFMQVREVFSKWSGEGSAVNRIQ